MACWVQHVFAAGDASNLSVPVTVVRSPGRGRGRNTINLVGKGLEGAAGGPRFCDESAGHAQDLDEYFHASLPRSMVEMSLSANLRKVRS